MEYKGIVENGLIRPSERIDFPNDTEVVFREVSNGPTTGLGSPAEASWVISDEQFRKGVSIGDLVQEHGVCALQSLLGTPV